MTDALRIKAIDAEDLQVVAAVLQDALISVGDMDFLANEHRFILVANRFKWENCSDDVGLPEIVGTPNPVTATSDGNGRDATLEPCRTYERVHCGLCFEGVEHVRARGINRQDRGRILELLHIEREPAAVVLLFAGDTAVRLEGASIVCRVEDFGDPWPTTWRPNHPLTDNA